MDCRPYLLVPVAARPLLRRIAQSSTQIFHEGSRRMSNENTPEVIIFRIHTWQEPTCLRGKEVEHANLQGSDADHRRLSRVLPAHFFSFKEQSAVRSSITKRASLFFDFEEPLEWSWQKHINTCVSRCFWHPVMLLGHGRWWSLWLYNPHGFLQQNCYCR